MALDAPAVAHLISDWDVIRMLTTPPYPYRVSDAEAFVADASSRPWDFAVYRGGDLIGMCGITDHLGYWFGKAYWGQGYATEAAEAVIAAYWAGTEAKTLLSGAFAENAASQRVLAKLGFRTAGRSLVWCAARGSEVEHLDLVMDRPRRADLT